MALLRWTPANVADPVAANTLSTHVIGNGQSGCVGIQTYIGTSPDISSLLEAAFPKPEGQIRSPGMGIGER